MLPIPHKNINSLLTAAPRGFQCTHIAALRQKRKLIRLLIIHLCNETKTETFKFLSKYGKMF